MGFLSNLFGGNKEDEALRLRGRYPMESFCNQLQTMVMPSRMDR